VLNTQRALIIRQYVPTALDLRYQTALDLAVLKAY
jgi:hypothetical protein